MNRNLQSTLPYEIVPYTATNNKIKQGKKNELPLSTKDIWWQKGPGLSYQKQNKENLIAIICNDINTCQESPSIVLWHGNIHIYPNACLYFKKNSYVGITVTLPHIFVYSGICRYFFLVYFYWFTLAYSRVNILIFLYYCIVTS